MNAGIGRRIKRLLAARGQGLKRFFVAPCGAGWLCMIGKGKFIDGGTKEDCLAKLDDYIERMGIENSMIFIDDLTEDLELDLT